MYEIDKLPQTIDIGYTGEHDFRQIQIDMTSWMETMPNGVPCIVHIRPGETVSDAYKVETTFSDNIITWDISMSDLGTMEGTGIAQVWLEDISGLTVNHRGKSRTFATVVHQCAGEADAIPGSQTNWEGQLALKVDKTSISNNLTTAEEGKVLDARQGKALDEKKVDKETGEPEGKFLQTDAFGNAVWGDPVAEETVRDEVDEWLGENITNPSSPPLDTSLSLSNAAAPANLAGAIKNNTADINNILKIKDTSDISWYKEKDYGVKYSTGEDVSSSVYSATNYIDVRAFAEITYKQHKTTSSSVNTGIAFYDAGKTYISGVVGIGSADAAGVVDNTVSVPENAAYVRCTIFRNQSTGAFSISGKSKLNEIATGLRNDLNHFGFFYEEKIFYENGSIDTSDGTNTSSMANRLRSGYCKLEDGFKVTVPDGWLFGFCLYSSASYSGYINFGGWKKESFELRGMPQTAKYVRFVLKKQDDSNISAGDASGVVIQKFIMDDTIIPAIVDLGIVQGSMNSSGGNSSANADKRLRTGYLPVDPAYGFSMTVPSGWKVNYFLYTSNNVSTFFFESSTKTDDYRMDYDGADTANYVRFWIRKDDDSVIVPSDASGIIGTFYKREEAGTSSPLYPNGTDQTAEIQKRLFTGRCELAPGSFHTTGVTMPEGSILIGSGSKTKLYMTATGSNSCITMNKSCTVRNIEIIGPDDEESLSGTIGNRHGINCTGAGSSETAWRCVISECWIHGFSGSGILMYKTGYAQAAKITDCYLFGNCVGLYIKDNSEYIHVNGCSMSKNYYGCINNGANNMFSCCTFSSNEYGLMMGDTSGTDYGAAAKCEVSASNFGHNTTRSIYINNMVSSGIGFTGCYISENGAEILASRSVNFTGCSMTDTFSLTVSGGGVILFTGSNFRNNFTVSDGKVDISNNDKVHFDGCYYYNGTACNPVH